MKTPLEWRHSFVIGGCQWVEIEGLLFDSVSSNVQPVIIIELVKDRAKKNIEQ
jgi:hypothetical protein